jgi:hypothetical protein
VPGSRSCLSNLTLGDGVGAGREPELSGGVVRLDLPVLTGSWSLRHQRPAGRPERFVCSRGARSLITHETHTAAGGAERGLQPVGKPQPRQVALIRRQGATAAAAARSPRPAGRTRSCSAPAQTRRCPQTATGTPDSNGRAAANNHACSCVGNTTSIRRSSTTRLTSSR